jgi:hypothetical protein
LTLTRLLQLGLRINVTPNQEVLQCHLMESPSGSSLGGLFWEPPSWLWTTASQRLEPSGPGFLLGRRDSHQRLGLFPYLPRFPFASVIPHPDAPLELQLGPVGAVSEPVHLFLGLHRCARQAPDT